MTTSLVNKEDLMLLLKRWKVDYTLVAIDKIFKISELGDNEIVVVESESDIKLVDGNKVHNIKKLVKFRCRQLYCIN